MTSSAPVDPSGSRRFATVLLVDDRGWVLLQERDDEAPRAANLWGMVGGHVEDDEHYDDAVYRELEEETGIEMPPGSLRLYAEDDFRYPDGYGGHYRVYAGRVSLRDADIVVGEGRQIVFVEPARIPELALAGSSMHFAVPFAGSPFYRDLCDEPPVTPLSLRSAD